MVLSDRTGVWEIEIKKIYTSPDYVEIETVNEGINTTGRMPWRKTVPKECFDFEPEEGETYTVSIERNMNNGRGPKYVIKLF